MTDLPPTTFCNVPKQLKNNIVTPPDHGYGGNVRGLGDVIQVSQHINSIYIQQWMDALKNRLQWGSNSLFKPHPFSPFPHLNRFPSPFSSKSVATLPPSPPSRKSSPSYLLPRLLIQVQTRRFIKQWFKEHQVCRSKLLMHSIPLFSLGDSWPRPPFKNIFLVVFSLLTLACMVFKLKTIKPRSSKQQVSASIPPSSIEIHILNIKFALCATTWHLHDLKLLKLRKPSEVPPAPKLVFISKTIYSEVAFNSETSSSES
ncbi:hypothetical protein LXL04_037303 [Taraxacum kok-saghyz]